MSRPHPLLPWTIILLAICGKTSAVINSTTDTGGIEPLGQVSDPDVKVIDLVTDPQVTTDKVTVEEVTDPTDALPVAIGYKNDTTLTDEMETDPIISTTEPLNTSFSSVTTKLNMGCPGPCHCMHNDPGTLFINCSGLQLEDYNQPGKLPSSNVSTLYVTLNIGDMSETNVTMIDLSLDEADATKVYVSVHEANVNILNVSLSEANVRMLHINLSDANASILHVNVSGANVTELCVFGELEELSITNSKQVNQSLSDLACGGHLDVVRLRLSRGSLQWIDVSGAAQLNPRVMDLSWNNVSQIETSPRDRTPLPGVPLPLPQLLHLDVSHNRLQRLEGGSWSSFAHIATLNLSHNLIEAVDNVMCAFSVPNLINVDLSYNSLANLHTTLLTGAVRLISLDLSNNAITAIDPGLFTCQLPSLESLNLAHNQLSALQDYAFSSLHKLRRLNLSYNSLTVVNGNAFDEDPLTPCYQYGNDTAWPQQQQRAWENLRTLDLSHNKISSLGQSTLQGSLANLRTLLMGHNSIQHLPKYGIESLKRLEVVDLQDNLIDWLDVGTFTNARLRHINLAHNRLTKIISMAFLFLPRIQTIDLSHNHLNYLYKYAFYRICKQQHGLYITLNGNTLAGDVIWKLWQTFRHLEQTGCTVHVDLHDNDITTLFEDGSLETIQKHFALQDVPYFFSWDYLQLSLGANPVTCDCVLYSQVQTLGTISRAFKRSLSFPDNLDFWRGATCTNPPFHNKTIEEALPLLDCPDVKGCPMLCDCFHQPHHNDIYVNCSHRGFTIFPEMLPEGPKALDFQGNMLTLIPPGLDFPNVTYLDFSHNHLMAVNNVTWQHLTGFVDIVLLNDNMLERLPVTHEPLASKKLALAGNPYSCRCGFDWVPSWVINHARVIADAKKMSCADGRRLISLKKDDFMCSSREATVRNTVGALETSAVNVPALVFAGVLFVCCIVVALLVAFRGKVRDLILSRSKWYKVHIEHERKYDVMVMLNASDVMWTERCIVSRLVNDAHRVYMSQTQDVFALEQLQSGVENSRSVVMIVSRAFLTEQLTDHNYMEVVRQMLLLSKHKVFVVFLDNAHPADLSAELRHLLRKKSWFSVEDDMFVDRLLLQLPTSRHHRLEAATTAHTGLMYCDNLDQDPLGNI